MSTLPTLFDISGKTAMVTGASRGLGAAAAEALAEAGANVVLIGRDTATLNEREQELREHNIETLAVRCDMAKPRQITAAVQKARKKFGHIDILVNNAGIIRRWPAQDYPEEDWNAVLDVDLTGVFLMAQAVGREMINRKAGKIINIASLLSFSGGKMVVAYTAAKSAVVGVTKALANEWGKHGINVNAIAPGYFNTEATEALRNDKKRYKELLGRIPAGRWGEPEDLKGTILYLASPASNYVNGHTLTIDGGWMAA